MAKKTRKSGKMNRVKAGSATSNNKSKKSGKSTFGKLSVLSASLFGFGRLSDDAGRTDLNELDPFLDDPTLHFT